MNDSYRGWTIRFDPPPIPLRSFDWQAYGPGYDASYEGEEDGFVDNGAKVTAATREELVEEIDAFFDAVEIGEGLGELLSREEGRRILDAYASGCEVGAHNERLRQAATKGGSA